MRIRFDWNDNGKGYLEYDTDKLIKEMKLARFKKWAELFAKYGTKEQHDTVLSLIKVCYQEEYEWLNLNLSLKDDKAVKATEKRMHFYNRKYEILLGLIQ